MSSNEQNGAFPYVSDQPGPWLLPFQYSNNFEQKPSVKLKKVADTGGQTKEKHQKQINTMEKNALLAQMTWRTFTKSTTFHGIKYIFDVQSFKLRRMVWLVCVLTASILFSIQVIDRCRDYFMYRSNVNVEIVYVEEVEFPSVTICNQNNYRITETVKYGLYDFIEQIYTNKSNTPPDLAKYNVNKYDVTNFTMATAHQEHDFIDSCKWKGRPCNISEDFDTTVTEFGVCYTFNSGKRGSLYVSESGSGYALALILNIEQYEYMAGPQDEAGVKVLLHDSFETPLVKDLGFAIAPGTHTLVGVQRQVVYGLSSPYGSCDDIAPPRSHCIARCRAADVISLCQCRGVFQPQVDNATICDMSTTYTCVKEYRDMSNQIERLCQCGVPCRRVTYTPELSYAHISKLTVDRLSLSDPVRKKEVQEKYEHAREVGQRYNGVLAESNYKMLQKVIRWSEEFSDALEYSRALLDDTKLVELAQIAPVMTTAYTMMKDDFEMLESDYSAKKNAYKTVTPKTPSINNILADFSKFMEYKDDGTSYLISSLEKCSEQEKLLQVSPEECNETNYFFIEKKNRAGIFVKYGADSVENAVDMPLNYLDLTHYLYGDTPFPLNDITEHEICIDVLSNLSVIWTEQLTTLIHLSGLYCNATSWTEQLELVKQMVLIYNMSNADDSILASDQYEPCNWYKRDNIQDNSYSLFMAHSEAAEKSYMDANGLTINLKTQIADLLTDYEATSQKVFQPINLFLDNSMTKLELQRNISSQDFRMHWQDMSLSVDKFMADFKQFTSKLLDLHNNVLQTFVYTFNFSIPVMNDTVVENLSHLKHVKDYRDIDPDFQHYLLSLPTSKQFSVLGLIDVLYGKYRNVMDASHNSVLRSWHDLKDQLEFTQSELETYARQSLMDDTFFTENYIKIDIFFKERSFEIIRQQVSFEFLSLVSEIGGFMGLLLGASILTLFELLDYLSIFFIRRCRSSHMKSTHSGSYLS